MAKLIPIQERERTTPKHSTTLERGLVAQGCHNKEKLNKSTGENSNRNIKTYQHWEDFVLQF